MAEHIERMKVISTIKGYEIKNCPEYMQDWVTKLKRAILQDITDDVIEIPAADVVEVVHGHNATSMHPVDEFLCSVCGFCCADYTETKYDEDGDYAYSCECEFDYCPRCGARMDGEKNDL